jgi:NADPH-dependent 2,4-dienoyl-CoA reductase/sulfur reductase-like enzyme
VRVVIIGNGIAGASAAQEIRRARPGWEIVMISAESPLFYSRPALMYVFMGQLTLADATPYPGRYWDDLRVERVRDLVTGVETGACRVLTRSGGPVGYDRLLVATGSRPSRFAWPGQDLDRVVGFHDLSDLARIERWSPGLRAAVIAGGGLIGLELAECLRSRGARVVLLAREPSYWNNVLPSSESRLVNGTIRATGIELRLEAQLAAIEGDERGEARAAITADGERIDCQLVALTAGVSPNLAALDGSGIATGRGVLVDSALRASVENVWAAGDCAELVGAGAPPGRVEQLWYTGRAQGVVAGRVIAGLEARYERGVPYNSAKFIDLEWQTYGRLPSELADPAATSLYWEHPRLRRCLRIVHGGGGARPVEGMDSLGLRQRHRVWERWISEARPVEEVLDHLAEAGFDAELSPRHERAIASAMREQLR